MIELKENYLYRSITLAEGVGYKDFSLTDKSSFIVQANQKLSLVLVKKVNKHEKYALINCTNSYIKVKGRYSLSTQAAKVYFKAIKEVSGAEPVEQTPYKTWSDSLLILKSSLNFQGKIDAFLSKKGAPAEVVLHQDLQSQLRLLSNYRILNESGLELNAFQRTKLEKAYCTSCHYKMLASRAFHQKNSRAKDANTGLFKSRYVSYAKETRSSFRRLDKPTEVFTLIKNNPTKRKIDSLIKS